MSIETSPVDNGNDARDLVQSFCERYGLEADSQTQADVVSLLDKPDAVSIPQFLRLLRAAGSGWKKDRADRAIEIYSMLGELSGVDDDSSVEDEETGGAAGTNALGGATLHIVQATEPPKTQMALTVEPQVDPVRRPRPSYEVAIPYNSVHSPQANEADLRELLTALHVPTDEKWEDRALCKQTDPEMFFPEKGGSTKLAKRVCQMCEVRVECLADALARGERYGIWGGRSERERRKLQKKPGTPLAVAKAALK